MKNNYKIMRKYFKALAISLALFSIINTQVFGQCPTISSTNGTPTGCGTGSGTASVTASGGTGTLTYLWNPGNKSGASINGLAAGTYTVTVTDAIGCSTTSSATVAPPSGGPTITIDNQKNIICHGDLNGNAYTSATGGTGSYSYSWSSAGISSTGVSSSIINVGAGVYTITYTDLYNFCSNSKTILITEPPAFNMAAVTTNIKCKGSLTGSINITPTGNTSPYVYDWSPVNKQTADISGLGAGGYSLTIIDAKGCTATFSYFLSEPSTIITAFTSSISTDCGSNTGTAVANVTGGTGTYTFSWNNGSQTAEINNLGVGSYTVTVTDKNGCASTAFATIYNSNGPTASAYAAIGICGKDDGTATVTSSGGTGAYTYSWTSGSTSATVTQLASGSYTVTVTDSKNCTTTASVFVNCVIGINELNAHTCFSIYPNPAKNTLNIELTDELQNISKLKLCLYDNIGKQVSCQPITNAKQQNVNTAQLSKGVYLISLVDEHNAVLTSQKVILE